MSDLDETRTRFGHGGPRANSGGARPGAGRKPRPPQQPAPPDLAFRWYVVRTDYQAELTADIAIRLAGFTLFAPMLWKPATRPRREADGSMRLAKPDRLEPLFPRYLLVNFCRGDPGWRHIYGLPGVDRILSFAPDAPVAVPDQVIITLRELAAPNGCIYPPGQYDAARGCFRPPGQRAAPLTVGAVGRVVGGPMADLTGLCTWSDGRRVTMLMDLLGRAVPVTVCQSEVDAA